MGESTDASLFFYSSSMDVNKDNFGVSPLDSSGSIVQRELVGWWDMAFQSGISYLVMQF